jgi:hypothetical protein
MKSSDIVAGVKVVYMGLGYVVSAGTVVTVLPDNYYEVSPDTSDTSNDHTPCKLHASELLPDNWIARELIGNLCAATLYFNKVKFNLAYDYELNKGIEDAFNACTADMAAKSVPYNKAKYN